MKNNILTYNELCDKNQKLRDAEYKSWNNIVETLYTSYLIGIIEGSSNDFEKTTIDKDSYKKSLQFFFNDIDNSLEEAIDLTHINYPDDIEEDLTIVPSEKLGKGWFWHKYNDGSGHLVSPDGKEYMSYDLHTNEYKETKDSEYDFFPLNYYYADGLIHKDFNPFLYMEEEMLKILAKDEINL